MLVLILPTSNGWKAEWTSAGKKVTQIFNPLQGRGLNLISSGWEAEILPLLWPLRSEEWITCFNNFVLLYQVFSHIFEWNNHEVENMTKHHAHVKDSHIFQVELMIAHQPFLVVSVTINNQRLHCMYWRVRFSPVRSLKPSRTTTSAHQLLNYQNTFRKCRAHCLDIRCHRILHQQKTRKRWASQFLL